MTGFSYVVSRDFGFAPNPFGEYCTLATCKPVIRRCAAISDLIIGITPKGQGNELIYAMKVNEKISFNQYWSDPRFQYKKPVMNGSIVQMMGDNIYFLDEKKNKWFQMDSHHSYDKGKINNNNVENDTKVDFVLVATHFFYFGRKPITLPKILKNITIVGRSHRCVNNDNSEKIWLWLKENYEFGIHAEPLLFKKFKKF
jgi:hypothetical protein